VLKKPQQVPVRYFFQQVEQLNGYLSYLPCTYESWQDRFDLNQEVLPTSVRKLLVVLENIEKFIVNSNTKEKTTKRKL
jgi:hypothetical protein